MTARVPDSYTLPPNAQQEEVLRVVFRDKFTEEMTERLFTDIIEVTEGLIDEHKADVPNPGHGSGQQQKQQYASAKGGTLHEKMASNHGEGTVPVRRPFLCLAPGLLAAADKLVYLQTGHDSYC